MIYIQLFNCNFNSIFKSQLADDYYCSVQSSVLFKTDGLFIKRVPLQPIWKVAAHRELEQVTPALAECLQVEWPSRVLSTEDRLSPVAPVPHSKISSLAKQRPRALELVKAPENNDDRLLLFL